MSHPARRSRHALAMPELLAVAAVALVAAALLFLAAHRTRNAAGLTQSVSNLRQIGAWSPSFSADHHDYFFGYAWTQGTGGDSSFPDLNGPFADRFQPAAAQATAILRKRTGNPTLRRIYNWIPQINYSHLVLAHWAGHDVPSTAFVSPGDATQLRWTRDPAGFNRGEYPPQPTDQDSHRWPYRSSYELNPAFYQPDGAPGEPPPAITQMQHDFFGVASDCGEMSPRRQPDVRFPAQKVMMHERVQHFFGAQDLFFMFAEARVPLLMADGAVAVRIHGEANHGIPPQYRWQTRPMTINYTPAAWEPPVPPGASYSVYTRHRWTRGGLKGRDFDGPPIDTSNWY